MAKILVALSGGVDSSVAASILKSEGHDIETGILLMRGVTEQARSSAKNIAHFLGVQHHEFDVSQGFDAIIIKNFVTEYQHGRTPNPCIICNEQIKMGTFLKQAKRLSCEMIATGHYALVTKQNDRFLLKRGKEKNEQSYFLYRLKQNHLAQLLLPLGTMTRAQVEAYAREHGMPSARQKKSQDICFVPGGDYPSFLTNYFDLTPGPITDTQGTIIGEHKGICAYTIGQRRGLGISDAQPYYVLRIIPETNTIVAGREEEVFSQELIAGELHFIHILELTEKMHVLAKPRYVSPSNPATIEPITRNTTKVVFDRPQWALTPGQSVVFYQDDTLLGGGVIQRVI